MRESRGSADVTISQARQATAVIIFFPVCCVFNCPLTRARQQCFIFILGVSDAERTLCPARHGSVSLPSLPLIILYKPEVAGGKRMVAPASRGAACVAGSNRASDTAAAPGFLGTGSRCGRQTSCSVSHRARVSGHKPPPHRGWRAREEITASSRLLGRHEQQEKMIYKLLVLSECGSVEHGGVCRARCCCCLWSC